jgi:hypothetical protein
MNICLQRHASPDRPEARDSILKYVTLRLDSLLSPIRVFRSRTSRCLSQGTSCSSMQTLITEPASIMWVGILDWTWAIIGLFHVAKGPTVRPWATTEGNPFLTEPDYTPGHSVRCVAFELAAYLKQVLGPFVIDPHRDPLAGLFQRARPKTEGLAVRTAFPCHALTSISIIQLYMRANMRRSTAMSWRGYLATS